jgi:GDP-L-fucose synthase
MVKKDAKIYVAGHRGLVGSAIVRQLEAKGYTNIITRTHAELDLVNQQAVEDFFKTEKPEYVFLAAAKVGGIMANSTYRGEFIYLNLMIQSNIMHQSKVQGVKRLVFLGSSCIYPKMASQPIKEEYLMTGPLEPTNSPYAVAKIAGIEMCHAYNDQYGTSFVPVMPTNLYGPGDNFDLEKSHVLPSLVRKFHLGKLAMAGDWEGIESDEKRWGAIPNGFKEAIGYDHKDACDCEVVLWGTGSPYREFLYVDDMANACVFIMFEQDSTELLNIGTGVDLTIREVAELVADVVGYEGSIVWDASKPDGTPRKVLDVSRMKKIGWGSTMGLTNGLKLFYNWYLSEA